MPSHVRKMMNNIRNFVKPAQPQHHNEKVPMQYRLTKQSMGLMMLVLLIILAVAYYWAMKNNKLPDYLKFGAAKAQSQHLHYFFF